MYELQGSPAMMSVDPSKGRNPQGGRSFYVREGSIAGHITASDDNEGTDPQFPLNSIQAALDKCVASMGDYVFVLYHSTILSAPITIPVRTIHLIAVSHGGFDSRNDLNGGNAVALLLTNDGRDLELAGFNLGNDDSDYAMEVEAGEVGNRSHIHHCTFGDGFPAVDGIHAASLSHMTIDNCKFGTQLSGHGIIVNDLTSSIIANCIFHKVGGKGIYMELGCQDLHAWGNMFYTPDDDGEAAGWAIDLAAGTFDNLIVGNKAASRGAAATNNPYRDHSAAAAADMKNGWVGNYDGEALSGGPDGA